MRINKFVALAMGISRRQADELVQAGKITLNDNVAELGAEVNEADKVFIGPEELTLADKQYYLLNKPVGYVCSKQRQGESPTIYDLLPKDLQGLKTVGRLDKDSSGLILLTNDGDFAHQMTHPSFQKEKVYEVELQKPLTDDIITTILTGVDLEDGVSKLGLKGEGKNWTVTMHEGRNRQIRRTFEAVGNRVTKLHRTKFGKFELRDLKPSELMKLTSSEVNS